MLNIPDLLLSFIIHLCVCLFLSSVCMFVCCWLVLRWMTMSVTEGLVQHTMVSDMHFVSECVSVCVRCLTYNKYVLILVSYSKSMVKVNPYKYLHRWTEISKCDLCVCGMSSGIFTELFCCIFLTSWFIPFSLNIVYIQFYLFFWPESLPIPRRQKEQWRYEPRGHLTDG